MNTDAFTTAARAEAEEYAWDRNAGTTHEDSLDRDAFASGYEYGAFWARDHLAAHSDLTVDSETVTVESDEPTDAEAQAYLDAFAADLPADTEWTRDTLDRVKRGLTAARGARR